MPARSNLLPLAERWYRRLLVLSLILGVVGGLAAVIYSEFTGFGNKLLFGDPSTDLFSGEWWWILLLAGSAVLVVLLRRWADVAEKVPGAIAYARSGWVEPSSALPLFGISALSLFVGASLGPSFGIVVAGGGAGSWLSQRGSVSDVEGQHEYALTGMAGGLSAVFAAPVFGTVMAAELSPSPRSRYVALFIPMFVASVIGYLIFTALGGVGLLGAFEISGYEYESIHLLYGLALGVFSVVVLLVQAVIGNSLRRVSAALENPFVKAAVFGGVVGFIAFAVPLTATGGSTQLAYETSNIAEFSVGFLLLVVIGKIIAFVLSQEAGFLGGPVFPILFIGGTAGIAVSLIFPDIPQPLAVAAMMAAIPGATIAAPISFIVLGAGVVTVGIAGLAPVGVAVITAHLAVWGLDLFRETRESM